MGTKHDNIASIRLLLQQKNNAHELGSIIGEIKQLGQEGAVLIPYLITRLKSGTYPSAIEIVPLIIQFKNGELLEAATKCWEQAGGGLNHRDKAELFAAGFYQFQPELIDYLRDAFDQDSDPFRGAIVDAFTSSGTSGLTQDLEDIAIMCERRLKDLKGSDQALSRMEQFDRKCDADLREDFLARLRTAIERVRLRPDLAIIAEPDPFADTDEVGGAAQLPPPLADAIINNPPMEWTHLHPEVIRHAGSLLKTGNHFHAVFEAVKAYDKAIAKAAGIGKSGSGLMCEAFGSRRLVKVSPCITETDIGIQEGTMHLSNGLMRVVRNPTAHEPAIDWPMSPQDALDILGLISFLFRQLDKAADNVTDSSGEEPPK